jgi:D-glycero-D-manno-heptose 1,7-bisphosphate phosphatase
MTVTKVDKLSTPRDLATVFLDRDGVINEKMPEGHYVSSVGEFRILPGVAEAIQKLNASVIRVIVVTNQRGVALGKTSLETLAQIHGTLQTMLAKHGAHIDGFFFCPHHRESCNCRKPLPGMYEQAVAQFPDIDASTSVMIGDSLSDIEFGRNIGMRTVYIHDDSSSTSTTSEKALQLADLVCPSLSGAVEALLAGVR